MEDVVEQKSILAKYSSKINNAAFEKMAKNYSLVMSGVDSRHVACGDSSERDTVRENFLKKKLGLTGDDALNASIEAVCVTMKEDRLKSRLVFYYLLAEKHGKLGVFA